MVVTELLGSLYNTTCWAVIIALAVAAWASLRTRGRPAAEQHARATVQTLAASKLFLAWVGIGGALLPRW